LAIAKQQTQLVGITIIGILGILLMGGGIFFYRFRLKKRTESLLLIQARSESELRALQAQMNPHFMFNILNSIQGAFYLGDKRAANAQMGLLASLTRKVLYMSNQKQISLQEEIEFLTEYITLEKARFNDDFMVEIKIDDLIDEEAIFMPPMLIQPYIENAIKHGLAPQKGEKRLHIHLWVAEKQLHCTISDNGIGRDAAATIAHHRQKYHTPFASEATARRLELLNQYQETPVSVRYHDGASENMAGTAGTTVHLTIPIVVEL
jgi:LytS/YehU family sensor histidine kinase